MRMAKDHTMSFTMKLLCGRREFVIGVTAILLTVCIGSFVSCAQIIGCDVTQIFPASQLWFVFSFANDVSGIFYMFVLPLASSIMVADAYFMNRYTRASIFVLARASKTKYLLCMAVSVFLLPFLVVLFCLVISQVLVLIAAPAVSSDWYSLSPPNYHFLYEMVMFPAVFSINQYVHNLIIMVIDAVYAGLIALTSYSISLFVQKSRFLVVALPGLTVLLWSFLVSILRCNRWSPIEYLSPVIAVAEPKHIVLAILFGGLFLTSICLLCIKCKRCVDEL